MYIIGSMKFVRWEFLKNVNIRLDYRGTKVSGKWGGGVLFSMNEAF